MGEPKEANKPETFEPVVINGLSQHQVRNGGDDVKEEETGDVAHSNLVEILVSPSLLNEIKTNFNQEENVYESLDILHGRVILTVFIVNLFKNEHEWRNDKVVDNHKSNPEVPDLAEGSLGIDEVPLQLRLIFVDLIVLIYIFIDVVDHHFL